MLASRRECRKGLKKKPIINTRYELLISRCQLLPYAYDMSRGNLSYSIVVLLHSGHLDGGSFLPGELLAMYEFTVKFGPQVTSM
jgi:hypothetical protein